MESHGGREPLLQRLHLLCNARTDLSFSTLYGLGFMANVSDSA